MSFINPFPHCSGVDKKEGAFAAPVDISDLKGFSGNPFVLTEDQVLERESYDVQLMVDPGDPMKEREIWHTYPGTFLFNSSLYISLPDDVMAYVAPKSKFVKSGFVTSSPIFPPGYKGLVTGQITIMGGDAFIQPGQQIGELVMVRVEK